MTADSSSAEPPSELSERIDMELAQGRYYADKLERMMASDSSNPEPASTPPEQREEAPSS